MKGFIFGTKKGETPPTPAEDAAAKSQQATRKGIFSGITAVASRAAGFNTSKNNQQKPQGIATSTGYVASQRQLNTTTLAPSELADTQRQKSPTKKIIQTSEENKESAKSEEETKSEVSSQASSTGPSSLMTTAGGDGLSFMVGSPNIFDLIEALKDGNDLLDPSLTQPNSEDEHPHSESLATEETEEDQEEEVRPKPYNDYELTSLDELPPELAPISVIIELVQHLEQIKESWRPQSLAEDEFLKTIRKIKISEKIFTCSHTLQLLIEKYKSLSQENEFLADRVDFLEIQNFDLTKDLNEKSAVTSYLQELSRSQQSRLEFLDKENKQLKARVEYLYNQGQELNYMKEHENSKIQRDTQYFKDRCDKVMLALKKSEQELGDLRQKKQYCDDVCERENARLQEELYQAEERCWHQSRRERSLLGHIELPVVGSHLTVFAACTFSFLETHDLVKLLQVNKESRKMLLGQNSRVFVSNVFCLRIKQLAERIDQWSTRNSELQRQLCLFEAKDKARNQLLQNVNDQRLRSIIEKHVVRPQLEQTSFQSTQSIVDESLRVSKAFLTNYVSLYMQHQQQIKKQGIKDHPQSETQQQVVASAVSETMKIQQQVPKQQQDLIGKAAVAGIQNVQKRISSTIFGLAGQKLFQNGFSYFTKKSQKQEPTEENNQAVVDAEEETKQQDPVYPSETRDIIEEERYQPERNFNHFVEAQQQIKEEEDKRPDPALYVPLDGGSSSGDIEQDSTTETISSISNAYMENTEKKHQAEDEGWQDVFDLAEIDTVEEMNDLVYKVSSFLVNDRTLLSKWISGIQQGFATLYIQIRRLNTDSKELELLKEFFAARIETLKLRIEELLNEREDYTAMHESDSIMKEHLVSRLNELDKQSVEKTTELLFQRKKIAELEKFKLEFNQTLGSEQAARKELELKSSAEIAVIKKRNSKLSKQSRVLREALSEMTSFFEQLDSNPENKTPSEAGLLDRMSQI